MIVYALPILVGNWPNWGFSVGPFDRSTHLCYCKTTRKRDQEGHVVVYLAEQLEPVPPIRRLRPLPVK